MSENDNFSCVKCGNLLIKNGATTKDGIFCYPCYQIRDVKQRLNMLENHLGIQCGRCKNYYPLPRDKCPFCELEDQIIALPSNAVLVGKYEDLKKKLSALANTMKFKQIEHTQKVALLNRSVLREFLYYYHNKGVNWSYDKKADKQLDIMDMIEKLKEPARPTPQCPVGMEQELFDIVMDVTEEEFKNGKPPTPDLISMKQGGKLIRGVIEQYWVSKSEIRAVLDTLTKELREWFATNISDGTFIQWVDEKHIEALEGILEGKE